MHTAGKTERHPGTNDFTLEHLVAPVSELLEACGLSGKDTKIRYA